jgi:hypothetical protein
MDELVTCMRMNHRIAAVPIVAAEAPTFDHGEMDSRPKPVPNASKISDNAAATAAPPKMAGQDTADACASFLHDVSATAA